VSRVAVKDDANDPLRKSRLWLPAINRERFQIPEANIVLRTHCHRRAGTGRRQEGQAQERSD